MNIKIRNSIIFVLFLFIVFLSTLTGSFSSEILFPKEQNQPTSFDGIIFDEPVNVSNFSVIRSIETDELGNLYKYDIKFTYIGDNSDLRILNTPVRQIFFPEGVEPSRSNAILKGDYNKVNQSISEAYTLQDLYSELDNFEFLATSGIRVPLSQEIEDYDFTIYTRPRSVMYRGTEKLVDINAFITNTKVDKFTDNLGLKEDNIEPVTATKNQSGVYINSLELIDKAKVSRVETNRTILKVLFFVGVILVFVTIWLNRKRLFVLSVLGSLLAIVTMPAILGKGVSNFGILVIMPILGFISYLLTKLYPRKDLKLEGNDFKQSLGVTIVFWIICLIVFIVPRGF